MTDLLFKKEIKCLTVQIEIYNFLKKLKIKKTISLKYMRELKDINFIYCLP